MASAQLYEMPQIYSDDQLDCFGGIKPVLNISEILDATCGRHVLGQCLVFPVDCPSIDYPDHAGSQNSLL